MGLNKLREITDAEIDRFSLAGKNVNAKVVQVTDGDTCDLAFHVGKKIVRYNCRLEDIDTAERGEKDAKGRDAMIARDFLAWLCTGNEAKEFDDNADAVWTKIELQEWLNDNDVLVYAKLGGFGQKHGRLLVTLKRSRFSRKTFNQLLFDKKYAKKYRQK